MTAVALWAGFAARDPESIRAVYQRYGRLVYSVSYRVLGEAGLAETATRQTFLQAWRIADTVDGDSNLGSWLGAVARRVAGDLHREQGHRGHEPADGTALTDNSASAHLGAGGWLVRRALEQLPDEDRELIRLRHSGRLTDGEIATLWDLPVGVVTSHSNRAHRRLAQLLGHLPAGSADDPAPMLVVLAHDAAHRRGDHHCAG